MPTQATSSGSILNAAAILVGGLSVALAVLIVGVDFKLSVATARPEIAFAEQTVNRAGKADRLVRASDRNAIIRVPSRGPGVDSKLADGCESLVSPLADALFARVARRCVS